MLSSSLEEFGIRIIRQSNPGEPEYIEGKKIFEEKVLPKIRTPESFSYAKLNQLENLQSAVIFPGDLWIRIPRSLPSMYLAETPNAKGEMWFYFLDDLLATYLWPGSEDWTPGFVRLTRDADFTLDFGDTDPESIPDVVMSRLSHREKGKPIRLQFFGNLDPNFIEKCRTALRLTEPQVLSAPQTMYMHGLWTLVNQVPPEFAKEPTLRYPLLQSKIPIPFRNTKEIFSRLKERDYLLHHPYDSFDAYVEWIKAACEDPNVESIEQTVYRTDAVSPVVELLKKAAKTKKVRVVIELRARFDELNNLRLADDLRNAGVQVSFGFGALKLHAKIALITRKEADGMHAYTHLSTGNYNAATARQYTDLAILTANKEIGSDARHFFDSIFKGHVPSTFKQLVVAPTRLAKRLETHIQEEAEAAKLGKKARIVAKVNALVDDGIIESLYRASQAGVKVDLIVRGACSLIPGIKGVSENIRVISIVDRFLEHSRIYYFENAKKIYLSSADWMPRNLFSRLEIAFPVLDPKIYSYLEEVVIPAYLSDNAKAKELTHQGTWKKRSIKRNDSPNFRSQVLFRELAVRDYKGTPLER
jgi:polyphosphate kinase